MVTDLILFRDGCVSGGIVEIQGVSSPSAKRWDTTAQSNALSSLSFYVLVISRSSFHNIHAHLHGWAGPSVLMN